MTVVIPWVVIGNIVDVVPRIEPLQLSDAEGAFKDVTSQTEFTSLNVEISGTGAVTSVIIIFWFCVEIFPFPSS